MAKSLSSLPLLYKNTYAPGTRAYVCVRVHFFYGRGFSCLKKAINALPEISSMIA